MHYDNVERGDFGEDHIVLIAMRQAAFDRQRSKTYPAPGRNEKIVTLGGVLVDALGSVIHAADELADMGIDCAQLIRTASLTALGIASVKNIAKRTIQQAVRDPKPTQGGDADGRSNSYVPPAGISPHNRFRPQLSVHRHNSAIKAAGLASAAKPSTPRAASSPIKQKKGKPLHRPGLLHGALSLHHLLHQEMPLQQKSKNRSLLLLH
jgi:hypothetical protein